MKDKILSAIRVAIGKTNINDRTLNAYVGIIADKITDESKIGEAIKPYVEVLKEFQGNMNSEIATQVAAVKNVQPPVNTPPAPATPTTPPVEEKPQWAKDLEAQMKTFNESQQNAAKQEQRNQIIENIRKTALTKDSANEKSGWASNAGILGVAIQLIQIEDTDTEEVISQKCQAEYNKRYMETFGTSEAIPGVGGGGVAESTDWSEEKRRLQERGSLPKDEK